MDALDKLIARREKKVELMKEDKDKAHQILAKLYSNPTHFITELIQNAEDEYAENIKFILEKERLIITHDSKRLFNFNDIKAISNFGDNDEKKEKPNVIGRFGIGFKSVYSITSAPQIKSGKYNITIKDYNIPYKNNTKEEYFNGTEIILPFIDNGEKRIYQALSNELRNLNPHYLLFLSNVKKIEWVIGDDNGYYKRTIRANNEHHVVLKNSSNEEIKYYLIAKNIKVDDKSLTLKMAIKLNNENNFIPCESSPLFVFFPTKIETNLNFLIHVPFYTTPTRENVKEGDGLINIEEDERNTKLNQALQIFVQESLIHLRNKKLLNIHVLNIFPLKREICSRSKYYENLYKAILELFQKGEKLISTITNTYASASNCMLMGNQNLTKLLNQKRSYDVFKKKHWVNEEINNTKDLEEYFKYGLNIPKYYLTDLIKNLDNEFLVAQTDKWLIDFYKIAYHKSRYLYGWEEKELLNLLQQKPIIRIEKGKHIKQICAFSEDNKPNVFLPTNGSDYITVKKNIAKNSISKEFLKYLGLTTPDIYAEINRYILPRLKFGKLYDEYFKDSIKIFHAFESNSNKKNKLLDDLKKINCIAGKSVDSEEVILLKYDQVYYKTDMLVKYFNENPNKFFTDEKLFKLTDKEIPLYKNFLSELGVSNTPNRIRIDANLSWDEKSKLRDGGQCSIENYCYDYELDGLNSFLDQEINQDRSYILWELLIERLKICKNDIETFLQGKYSFKKRVNNYSNIFEAKFIKQLKEVKWLYNGLAFVVPNNISLSDLPAIFSSNRKYSEKLAGILGFRPDVIQEYLKDTDQMIITRKEWEKYQKNIVSLKQKDEIQESEAFEPEYKPDDVEVVVMDYIDPDVNTPSISTTSSRGEPIKSTNSNDNEKTPPLNQKQLNDIGDWGQEFVYIALINEYSEKEIYEICDLNENNMIGIGCDFIVKKENIYHKYIEVKSTTLDIGHPLSVSKAQWSISRKFYKNNEGDTYYIYCVFNAGTKNARIIKICNPYKLWLDGKLDAYPVEIIVKG